MVVAEEVSMVAKGGAESEIELCVKWDREIAGEREK